jgi:hypothetical protein
VYSSHRVDNSRKKSSQRVLVVQGRIAEGRERKREKRMKRENEEKFSLLIKRLDRKRARVPLIDSTRIQGRRGEEYQHRQV